MYKEIFGIEEEEDGAIEDSNKKYNQTSEVNETDIYHEEQEDDDDDDFAIS